MGHASPGSKDMIVNYSIMTYLSVGIKTIFALLHLVQCDGLAHYNEDIRMPFAVPDKPDLLMCTSVKLDPDEAYIVSFSPHASQHTVHHMMVYGCPQPATPAKMWRCDDFDSAGNPHSVCAGGIERQILFAWARNAPAMQLPEGVGLRVSGGTSIKHAVLQLHYARAFSDGESDNSGVTLHMTRNRPPQQMGYYVLAHTGTVEPQKKEVHLETACMYQGEEPIYPIGFRTHSHNLGVVTSGYRIRNGVWTLIGRMSPVLPQTFYPVAVAGMDIQKGDILASRCTMNSMSRWSLTKMGPANHDEMCNFYIMYSTYDQANLHNIMCAPPSPTSTWKDMIPQHLPPPADASSLIGIPNSDYILSTFNMTR